RLRVGTHVTANLMSRLPVPVVTPAEPLFHRLEHLAHVLSTRPEVETTTEYAELQSLVARRYELSADDFSHILGTFPLIPEGVRAAAYDRFVSEGSFR